MQPGILGTVHVFTDCFVQICETKNFNFADCQRQSLRLVSLVLLKIRFMLIKHACGVICISLCYVITLINC